MAPTWGSAKGTGSTKFRVGIELTIPTPSVSDTAVTVTTKVWVWTKDKVTDSSVTLTQGGSAVNPGTTTVSVVTPSNSDWSTSNQKLVHTSTKSVPTSYVDQELASSATVSGINSAGSGTSAWVTVQGILKKSPAVIPDAPTGAEATRVSDSSQIVTWANTNPTVQPKKYLGLRIQRWDNVGKKWISLKSLGVVSAFTDLTTVADRGYQYQVQAFNGAGGSTWSRTATIYTRPKAPSQISAKRSGSNVVVTWKNESTIATSWRIRYFKNGVDQGVIASVSPATTTTWTHVSPDASAAHRYEVIAVAGGLESVVSGAVDPGIPAPLAPLHPTDLLPDGTIHAASEPLTLRWRHVSADSSAQTARSLMLREAGTDTNLLASTGRELTATANASTDQLTAAAHYLRDGDPVKVMGGVIPAPLAAGTYYAIVDSPSLLRLALTEDNAEDRIAINLTANSSGVMIRVPSDLDGNSAYVIAGGLTAGKRYEWSAATKGLYSGVSPVSDWAPMASFSVATKPLATIVFPEDGDTTMSPYATVVWGFYSPDLGVQQGWWQASLWRDTTLLEDAEGEGAWDSYTFSYELQNGVEYRIELVTEGTNGLASAMNSVTFTPEFIGPIEPGIALTWDADDGIVEIDITNPSDSDKPLAANNIVEHSLPGGAWTQIARNVPPNTTILHYLPTPNVVNQYRIKATSSDGKTTSSTAAISCDNTGDWYWLNGGTAFNVIAKARYSGGVDIDLELDKELHDFAGRTRPVEYTGTIVRQEIEISAQFPRDEEGYESMADFERLVRTPGLVYYRDMVGRRIKCSLSKVSFSDSENLIDFSAKLTESD